MRRNLEVIPNHPSRANQMYSRTGYSNKQSFEKSNTFRGRMIWPVAKGTYVKALHGSIGTPKRGKS